MKKIFIPFLFLFVSSCSVTNYYQVYTATSDAGKVKEKAVFFEDSNCIVSYNLWENGGDMGFAFYNKTDYDITIDLNKTFFIINGISYQYFQNRITTIGEKITTQTTSSYNISTTKTSVTTTTQNSIVEKQYIIIPSKTKILLHEYKIVDTRYVNCDMPRYPTNNNPTKLEFHSSDSPFKFSNLITYMMPSDTIRIENKFYVKDITNFRQKDVMVQIDKNICGDKLTYPITQLMNGAPCMFYIVYQ